MPGLTFNNVPLAFLFFAAFIALGYPELKGLDPFLIRQSCLCLFAVLGPLTWIEWSLVSSPLRPFDRDRLASLGDMLSEMHSRRLRLVVWVSQAILVACSVLFAALWL